jgi:DNA-binding CsgD family transcriptional regulator
MHNGTISGQARLFAVVGELDASPAPATEVAAGQLAEVIGALVPGDLAMLCLGDGTAVSNVQHAVDGRLNADVPLWSSGVRGREHPVAAYHDPTGLMTIGRRADVGSPGSLRPAAIRYCHFWRPFGVENMLGAPVDFPNERSYLASYRAAHDFSDDDIRLLDQLRPIASRLLRRAAVSNLAAASATAWGLAPREAEVFAFAGVGLSQPSIASILGLSVGTVRTHLAKAYAKTSVRSRAAATSALLDVVEPTALQHAGRGLVSGEKGPLTRREFAVLRIAATGRTTAAIASAIGISTETAKTHLANVYRKLGVQNRSQALLLVATAPVSLDAQFDQRHVAASGP